MSFLQDLEHSMEGLKREMAQEPGTVLAVAWAQEGVAEDETHEEGMYSIRKVRKDIKTLNLQLNQFWRAIPM